MTFCIQNIPDICQLNVLKRADALDGSDIKVCRVWCAGGGGPFIAQKYPLSGSLPRLLYKALELVWSQTLIIKQSS